MFGACQVVLYMSPVLCGSFSVSHVNDQDEHSSVVQSRADKSV